MSLNCLFVFQHMRVGAFSVSGPNRSFLLCARVNTIICCLNGCFLWTFLLRLQSLICDLDRRQTLVCVCVHRNVCLSSHLGLLQRWRNTRSALRDNQRYVSRRTWRVQQRHSGRWKATGRLDCPLIFSTLIKCMALTDFWYIADGRPCNIYGSEKPKPNQYEHTVFILTLGVKEADSHKPNFTKVQ